MMLRTYGAALFTGAVLAAVGYAWWASQTGDAAGT